MTFTTVDGVPVPSVTAAQMAEVDRIAVEDTGPRLLQMMENAGRSLAGTALAMLADGSDDGPVVVLAGTGGNGGGGLAAARHLANRGLDVRVVLTAPDRLADAAAVQRDGLEATGAGLVTPDAVGDDPAALVVDALLGYGLRDAPRGTAGTLVRWTAAQDAPVLALDVPSGLDATTGDAPGDVVTATTTLTLALPKPGLVDARAGRLLLADLGIPAAAYDAVGVEVERSPFRHGFVVELVRHGRM